MSWKIKNKPEIGAKSRICGFSDEDELNSVRTDTQTILDHAIVLYDDCVCFVHLGSG